MIVYAFILCDVLIKELFPFEPLFSKLKNPSETKASIGILRLIKEDAETDYTLDKALEDIDKEIQELKDIATKYDYSKLPKDI